MTNAAKGKSEAVVAEICLYGIGGTPGAGFIVRMADGRMIGNGEPLNGRSFTEAMWLALDEVVLAGARVGRVEVFHPNGTLRASVSLRGPRPYFGALQWEAAPVYVISADEIIRAATKEG